MHLDHGDRLIARSAGGRTAPCTPHPELPHVFVTDTAALEPGEPFRYVVVGAGGTERAERYFAHHLGSGGPLDVWDGIRSVDSPTRIDEIRRSFRRRGYAVVPGLLSADVTRGALSVVEPLAEAAWGRDGARVRDKLNLEKVLLCVPYLLQNLVEKLALLLQALVGPRVFLEYEQVLVVHANSTYTTQRHRDIDGGKEPLSEASLRDKGSVHLWIPFIDVDETRAGMYVEPLDTPGQPVNVRMRAGDALFLDNYIWHGCHANSSAMHRFSWVLTFAPIPSEDRASPSADLNLLVVRYGVPSPLGPEVCERLVVEKSGLLNLFDAFFTYDARAGQMANPQNRNAPDRGPTAPGD